MIADNIWMDHEKICLFGAMKKQDPFGRAIEVLGEKNVIFQF